MLLEVAGGRAAQKEKKSRPTTAQKSGSTGEVSRKSLSRKSHARPDVQTGCSEKSTVRADNNSETHSKKPTRNKVQTTLPHHSVESFKNWTSPKSSLGSHKSKRSRSSLSTLTQSSKSLATLPPGPKQIEAALVQARECVAEKHYDVAIHAANQAVKLAQLAYKSDDIRLVEPYQLFCTALLHQKRFDMVRQFISIAQWLCVKSSEHEMCTPTLKAKNHEILGLLYLKEGDSQAGVRELAHCAYQTAIVCGPDSVRMTRVYSSIAHAFFLRKERENGMAVVNQILEIWSKFLEAPEPDSWRKQLDGPGMAEGGAKLGKMAQYCDEFCGAQHSVTGHAHYMCGLWHEVMKKPDHAKGLFEAARTVAHARNDKALLERTEAAMLRV